MKMTGGEVRKDIDRWGVSWVPVISYISDGCELIQLDSWASRLFLGSRGNDGVAR